MTLVDRNEKQQREIEPLTNSYRAVETGAGSTGKDSRITVAFHLSSESGLSGSSPRGIQKRRKKSTREKQGEALTEEEGLICGRDGEGG